MKEIKVIILDVDGTLTDGKIIIDNNGKESKQFNVKDGLAIAQSLNVGIDIVILTGRQSDVVNFRCKELGIKEIYQGIKDKTAKFEEIINEKGYKMKEVAYIGDDINDLSIMIKSGFAACPADAASEVKNISHMISRYNGGDGAVRETIEAILKEQGKWESIVKNYKGTMQ